MEKKSNSNIEIRAGGILGIVLIVLKILGIIDWSWFWVLSPFWVPVVLLLIFIIVWVLIMIIIQE